jgi:hypothetical protein
MLGLLERRCARAGLPRPQHATPSRWLAEVSERMAGAAPAIRPLSEEIAAFVSLADQALYAPAFVGNTAEGTCRSAGRIWSLKQLMTVMSLEKAATPKNVGQHAIKEFS